MKLITKMTDADIKLLTDFVYGTPKWVESMRMMNLYKGGGKKSKPCLYCGCDPEKMQLLANAISKLLK